MKGLKKRRRIQIVVVAALALALATALVGHALRGGISFFRSPSEVALSPPAEGEVFRIGGLVEAGSLVRGQGEAVSFRITDGTATVTVRYRGILPDLFGEGQGTVATGRMAGDVFEAREVLAKHDETYMPREVVEALKEQGHWMAPDGG